MRLEARVAGLEIQVIQLEQRLAHARQDLERLERERAWWEEKWRAELAARYRVLAQAMDRGVYLTVEP